MLYLSNLYTCIIRLYIKDCITGFTQLTSLDMYSKIHSFLYPPLLHPTVLSRSLFFRYLAPCLAAFSNFRFADQSSCHQPWQNILPRGAFPVVSKHPSNQAIFLFRKGPKINLSTVSANSRSPTQRLIQCSTSTVQRISLLIFPRIRGTHVRGKGLTNQDPSS